MLWKKTLTRAEKGENVIMKKSRKGVALFLAMTMIISPMSALAKEGDASSGRVSGGLEDSGGIVNKGADFVENDKGDVVVQVSDNVWNNQNQKHAEFKDAEALFNVFFQSIVFYIYMIFVSQTVFNTII